MIFNHRVKHNGVVYPPGANVPVDVPKKVEVKPAIEEIKEVEVEEKEAPKKRNYTPKKRK